MPGDGSVRWLVLGPGRAGNLLELVVIDRLAGQPAATASGAPP
jgi:hypothetical protein